MNMDIIDYRYNPVNSRPAGHKFTGFSNLFCTSTYSFAILYSWKDRRETLVFSNW